MFDPTTLTGFHTWLSLVAIAAGFVVLPGLLRGRASPAWTAVFLVTAFATSATGFLFPFGGVLPSHIVGAVALVVLAIVLVAARRQGGWRRAYAAGLVVSLYLLVFVAVAQAFNKIPALARLAPTQSEPPFALAEGVVLVVFAWLAVLAWRRGRDAA